MPFTSQQIARALIIRGTASICNPKCYRIDTIESTYSNIVTNNSYYKTCYSNHYW